MRAGSIQVQARGRPAQPLHCSIRPRSDAAPTRALWRAPSRSRRQEIKGNSVRQGGKALPGTLSVQVDPAPPQVLECPGLTGPPARMGRGRSQSWRHGKKDASPLQTGSPRREPRFGTDPRAGLPAIHGIDRHSPFAEDAQVLALGGEGQLERAKRRAPSRVAVEVPVGTERAPGVRAAAPEGQLRSPRGRNRQSHRCPCPGIKRRTEPRLNDQGSEGSGIDRAF